MKKIMALLASLVMALVVLAAPTANATGYVNSVPTIKACDGVYKNVTLKRVTVRAGDSCVLKNVTVLGGVHAKKGAVDVKVLDSTVGRNIQVNGATGDVHIGQSKCTYDPTVGNNVHVTNSHNVLICWVSTKNNIMITRNDGRVTVRDSVAGNNLTVARNKAYNGDGPTDHNHPAWVRVLRNQYDNNLFTNNPARKTTVVRKNTEF